MTIPFLDFGRTGHKSARTIFGAASLSRVTQDVADHTLEVLLPYGVNHIDTAASYGEAELRIRPWLKGEPPRVLDAAERFEKRPAEAEEISAMLERAKVEPLFV